MCESGKVVTKVKHCARTHMREYLCEKELVDSEVGAAHRVSCVRKIRRPSPDEASRLTLPSAVM